MSKNSQKINPVSIRSSAAEYLTYVAAVGGSEQSVEMRYEDENVWLTQKMMAELYGVSVPAINQHIKNILEDDYLTILDEDYQRYMVILLALIFTLIGLYLRSFTSLFITVLFIIFYTIIAFICFKHNIYIGVSKQLLAIFTTNVLAMVIQAYFENKEKRFITSSFKQYISPELIDEMVEDGITPQLGGEESVITAYFTDIQGFSTFSEKI